jgi:hypothetical protein
VHRLDATASLRIAETWRVKIGGRNLLDSASRFTIGDEVASEVKTGWSASLGLSWSPELSGD